MARPVCPECQRLKVNCLCAAIKPIANQTEVLIIQHPLEVKQIKGTAYLTHLVLQNSQLWVAEQLNDAQITDILTSDKRTWLLYSPTDDFKGSLVSLEELSIACRQQSNLLSQIRLVVLDGTWKKTRKMLYLNPALASLPRLTLQPENASQYVIRKQKNSQSLSTLEAIGQALSSLENDSARFVPLSELLQAMMAQYLQHRQSS